MDMSVRHRNVPPPDTSGGEQTVVKRAVATYRKLDVYTKPIDEFRVQTYSGAIITIISGLIMVMLFFSELRLYQQMETKDRFSVDLSRGEKMIINLNITFPSTACPLLHLDAIDASGEQQVNVVSEVSYKRLEPDGKPVSGAKLAETESPDMKELNANLKDSKTYCGSCYGAEDIEGQCCNTCDDVKRAFAAKDSLRDAAQTDQCLREALLGRILQNIQANEEGCEISGKLIVNKVAGNFHFAPGKSYEHAQMHIHEFMAMDTLNFNVSHIINHLSFGVDFPGVQNPLDGLVQLAPDGPGIVNYYVKVVPTSFQNPQNRDEMIKTNQYSVTMHTRKISPMQGMLPGVFVAYDLSPIMVTITHHSKSFLHFLTNVCAIVGGVFTVAGIVDSIVYNSLRQLKSKRQGATLG